MDRTADRTGIFAGEDPFAIARAWLEEAEKTEPNDPNAIALATVDPDGLPNVRMVLLKEIEDAGFVFYTNYTSKKGAEIAASGKAAFVLPLEIAAPPDPRARADRTRRGPQADAYYDSRSLKSRLGAWASRQSQPLSSREALMAEVAKVTLKQGMSPSRPPFWGGIRIRPVEIEFWADGAFRLHDRFRWTRASPASPWVVDRLNP